MSTDTPTPDRRETFYAYFYWFDATGVEPVDDILRTVARAGKSYHHTEGWQDPPYDDPDGPTERDKIAAAGDAAADEIVRLRAENEQLREALRRIDDEGTGVSPECGDLAEIARLALEVQP